MIKTIIEGKTPKTFEPGTRTFKINSVKFEENNFLSDSPFAIIFNVEGEDLGPEWEGFETEYGSGIKALGQVGKIRSSEWYYQDKVVSGRTYKRDTDVLRFMDQFCKATGMQEWLLSKDSNPNTNSIEDLMQQFNDEAPFKDKWFTATVAGREYYKEGTGENAGKTYKKYDLYLPNFKDGSPIELMGTTPSGLIPFDPLKHIKAAKKPQEVQNFDGKKTKFEL